MIQAALRSWLRATYSPQHPLLRQGNFLSSLQILNLSLQVFSPSLGDQVLTGDRFQLLVGQLAHKSWGKDFDRRVRAVHKEIIPGLHADVVHEALTGDLVVCMKNVVEIFDRVLEIATGRDALIEDCIELDHSSLVRVHYIPRTLS